MRLFRPSSRSRAGTALWPLTFALLASCSLRRGDDKSKGAPTSAVSTGAGAGAPEAGSAGGPANASASGAAPALAEASPSARASVDAAGSSTPGEPASAGASAGPVPAERPLRRDTQDDLLALLAPALAPSTSAEASERALAFLRHTVGPGSPSRMNQGNPALARRAVEGAACRRSLEGLILQTPEQRTLCGADNMVPIYRGGKANEARACVDLFEFPNVACELPLVWASPTQARGMCEAAGKRLCTQDEWTLACAGDPAGGADQRYAYGDALDLAACNTNKPAASFGGPPCDPTTAADAWRTCRTNAEPAGAFPRCRSRFGVFDLHGNVAEIMTRRDDEGRLVSQLKGSAFFYVDVARRHDEKLPPKRAREIYPDHCAHDPRWHVEPMNNAWHVNYHLGFRCCKTVARAESLDARPRAAPKTRRASRGTRAGAR